MKRLPIKSLWKITLLSSIPLIAVVVWVAAPVVLINPQTLKTERPQTTALMNLRQQEARRHGKPYSLDYRWVPLSRISPFLRDAVRLSEDAAFFDHSGIDWQEARKSLKFNWQKKRFARGASTITMQLARNLYLNPSKNPLRKVQEILIARRLERNLGKVRILELYLNVVEWGTGIFGAEAAAQRHFRKPASELNREEAARLAAVLPSPLRWNPASDQRVVLRRKNLILRRLEATVDKE